jgi:chaperonin GroEL (HSP60 family)
MSLQPLHPSGATLRTGYVSLILRGPSADFLAELQRGLNDALHVVRGAVLSAAAAAPVPPAVGPAPDTAAGADAAAGGHDALAADDTAFANRLLVQVCGGGGLLCVGLLLTPAIQLLAGGGSCELALAAWLQQRAVALRRAGEAVSGAAHSALADAMLVVPRVLAENAGGSPHTCGTRPLSLRTDTNSAWQVDAGRAAALSAAVGDRQCICAVECWHRRYFWSMCRPAHARFRFPGSILISSLC